LAPLIVQIGLALMVTIFSHVAGQPFLVTFARMVKVPAAPAFTRTREPLLGPEIEPFPKVDQAYVTVPPDGLTVAANVWPVDPAHTTLGPVIEQIGLAFTVTPLLQKPGQPFRITLRLRAKLPAAAPAVTVTEGPFVKLIDPFPPIDQKYMSDPPAGLTVAV